MTQERFFDFSQEIKRLTEKFIGRKWIFKEIDNWLNNQDERFFLLAGEPGAGKSAIVAKLTQIRQDIVAYHFCSARNNSTIVPKRVLDSVIKQFANSLPGYTETLISIAEPKIKLNANIEVKESRNSTIIGNYIEKIEVKGNEGDTLDIIARSLCTLATPQHSKIIMIDSLDEAVNYSDSGKENLVRLLTAIEDFPSWIRLLLTTRPEDRVLTELEPLESYLYQIEKRATQNMADIKEYVQARIEESAIQEQIRKVALSSQTLINEITKLADGNVLFAKLLLNSIAEGQQPLDNLSALPKDLNKFYKGCLNRLGLKSWQNIYRPILGTLAVTQEQITEDQLEHFTKIPPEELRDRLGIIRQFLSEIENDEGDVTYAIFHQSLRDFLLHKKRNENYWCDAKTGHKKITSYCLSKSPRKWYRETGLYGFKYIFTHLKFAQQVDEAVDLLSNLDFISGKVDCLGGESLLEDFYSCYRLLKSEDEDSIESQVDKLLTSLFKYLLEITPAEDNKFDLDYVHSNLVHRTDTGFYERFLQLGVDREFITACTSQPEGLSSKISNFVLLCQKYLANLKRRKGELQEAELLLEKVLESLENAADQNPTSFKEKARLEYDIGYIQWLRGRINDAVKNH